MAGISEEAQKLPARRTPAEGNFYLGIALVMALVVAAGFGRTINTRLFHPPSERPWILYVHAALFTIWVVLFIVQTALVRCRLLAWHRRLGLLGVIVGAFMPFVGIATGLAMARLDPDLKSSKMIDHDERFLAISSST
jgi:hypothetical protein